MADRPGGSQSADEAKLHSLGYAQELRRGMKTFSNFAVSFTIISILSGCLTLFGFAMNTGGPAIMTLGWLFVGFFVLIVALGMAEVASSYPTAGGLYYWSAKLADEAGADGARWSWFVGWFNLVGQVAVTAGIDFGLAFFTNAFLRPGLRRPGRSAAHDPDLRDRPDHPRAPEHVRDPGRGHPERRLGVVAPGRRRGDRGSSASCSTSTTEPTSARSSPRRSTTPATAPGGLTWPGPLFLSIPLYVALIGLLNAQYTLTGFDASAHMSEETHDAQRSAPRGIVYSVIISVIAGFVLLVAMNIGITPDKVFLGADGSTMVDGYTHALSFFVPPAQIWIDDIGQTGGLFILLIVIGAQFYCGMSSVTANSRMIYAFSRDGAIPGSRFWHRINKRTRTPTNSIWFAAVGAFILGVPYLFNSVAYFAVTSIAVIGLYVAYIAPGLPAAAGRAQVPGRPLDARALEPADRDRRHDLGIVICILFLLPQVQPINASTFNYTPLVFLIVLGGAAIWYFASAKNWFHGPKVQGTAAELAAIEAELEVI